MNLFCKITLLTLAIFASSCSKDSDDNESQEYYIRYSASILGSYPISSAGVVIINEHGENENIGGRNFQSVTRTIGPVYKGFKAEISITTNPMKLSIECCKGEAPFVLNSHTNSGSYLTYTIDF